MMNDGTHEKAKQLKELLEQVKQKEEKRCKDLGRLQEALNNLRLQVKYLIFDLEATKRENHELKEKIKKLKGEI